jgi:hypothetical protein
LDHGGRRRRVDAPSIGALGWSLELNCWTRLVGLSHLTKCGNRDPVVGVARGFKDNTFRLVTELQKPDAKKRLSIGQAVEEPAGAYNVYRNALGQIMLDPVKAIPVYEAWLFENQGRPSSSDA